MSELIGDGGPAFPVDDRFEGGVGKFLPGSPGMSMLDYFAGQAMVAMVPLMQKGLLKDYDLGDDATMGRVVAAQAYGLAVDMLNERERINGDT